MDRKILVGSIVAVAILVGVSFTSVVGYSSVKSNSGKESPLFKVRSDRAIGEESKILTSNYASKENTLPFPNLNDRSGSVNKIVNSIRIMDDKTYETFIISLISNLRKDDRFNGINPNEIKEVFNLLRNQDKSIPKFNADINLKFVTGSGLVTVGPTCCCITFGYGIEGFIKCILVLPYGILIWLAFIINIISDILTLYENCT